MTPKPPTFDIGSEWVQLGSHAYEVVDQPWPYLSHEIGEVIAAATLGDIDASNALAFFGGRAYDLVRVFIPDLMPAHEWHGFASAEAMAEGTYDPIAARLAPTPSQIKTAIRVCMKVSGLDAVKMLGGILDPPTRAWLKAKLGSELVGFLENASPSDSSPPAPTPSTTSSPPASPTEDITPDEPMMDPGSASSPLAESVPTG